MGEGRQHLHYKKSQMYHSEGSWLCTVFTSGVTAKVAAGLKADQSQVDPRGDGPWPALALCEEIPNGSLTLESCHTSWNSLYYTLSGQLITFFTMSISHLHLSNYQYFWQQETDALRRSGSGPGEAERKNPEIPAALLRTAGHIPGEHHGL